MPKNRIWCVWHHTALAIDEIKSWSCLLSRFHPRKGISLPTQCCVALGGLWARQRPGQAPPVPAGVTQPMLRCLGGLSLEQLSPGVQVSPSDVLAFARPHGLPCHPSASPGDNTSCGDCKAVCSHQGECCTQTMRHWSA